MSEEMQEEYCSLQEEIESCGDYVLQNRFNEISEQHDNPDKLQDRILKDMFPDAVGEWGVI